jgi:hypothetical protein
VRLAREIQRSARNGGLTGWPRRLAAWGRGFDPVSAAVYGLENGVQASDASLYLRDFSYAYHCYRLNGFWNPILTNKLVMSRVLAAAGLPHPEVLAVVAKGKLLAINADPIPREDILTIWTSTCHKLVFRPHWSGGGEGVFFLTRAGDSWRVNGHRADIATVRDLISGLDRYLVTAFVEQATYARAIQPATANTLRVLALRDEQGVFVASVVHRFGTTATFPIDNFHGGRGLCAAVDMEREQLKTAVSLDGQGRRLLHTHHPETSSQIEGVAIKGLRHALDGVRAASRCLPEAICVGWDVLITNDGYSLLEANAPPASWCLRLTPPCWPMPELVGYSSGMDWALAGSREPDHPPAPGACFGGPQHGPAAGGTPTGARRNAAGGGNIALVPLSSGTLLRRACSAPPPAGARTGLVSPQGDGTLATPGRSRHRPCHCAGHGTFPSRAPASCTGVGVHSSFSAQLGQVSSRHEARSQAAIDSEAGAQLAFQPRSL